MMNPLSLKAVSFNNTIDQGLDLTDVQRIPTVGKDLQVWYKPTSRGRESRAGV